MNRPGRVTTEWGQPNEDGAGDALFQVSGFRPHPSLAAFPDFQFDRPFYAGLPSANRFSAPGTLWTEARRERTLVTRGGQVRRAADPAGYREAARQSRIEYHFSKNRSSSLTSPSKPPYSLHET